MFAIHLSVHRSVSVHFSGFQLKSGSRDISKTIQGSLMNLLCEQVAMC